MLHVRGLPKPKNPRAGRVRRPPLRGACPRRGSPEAWRSWRGGRRLVGAACRRSCSSPARIRTSCSSPSTRCAPTRCRRTADRRATPNLDRLAAHGARFTFAHSHTVVTLPSHTSILSGPAALRARHARQQRLPRQAGTATLATRLKARGFATGAFVGGFPLTKRFGLTPGFDVYDDQMPEMQGASRSRCPSAAPTSSSRARSTGSAKQPASSSRWVHVFDPHSPYKPPDEYRVADTRAAVLRRGRLRRSRARRRSSIGCATLSRPTLVIVTADHGESLGEHGELTHGMFAYEATLHVPLIVAAIDARPRGQARADVVIDAPVRHIDIVPTVLDAVGAAADPVAARARRSRRGRSDRRRRAIARPTSSR